MRTIATPTYYCVAFGQNCVANCSATPDKLFPDIFLRPGWTGLWLSPWYHCLRCRTYIRLSDAYGLNIIILHIKPSTTQV